MMELTVKFGFNNQLQPRTSKQSPAAGKPEKSCSAKYNDKRKRENPERYEEFKKKDAARKRESYVPMSALTEEEQKQRRSKWNSLREETGPQKKENKGHDS